MSSHHGSDRRVPARNNSIVQSCIRIEPPSDAGEGFDDSLDHVVLAIDKNRRNTVGSSYYVANDGVLYIMEDIDSAEEETANLCMYAVPSCNYMKIADRL